MNKTKLILTLLLIATTFLSAYFGIRLDSTIELLKEKQVDTVLITDTTVITEFVSDTLTIPILDTIQDTTYLTNIVLDTVWLEKVKPIWGTIRFEDNSNPFTDVKIVTDFPYGRRQITYENKYKIKKFRTDVGIGYIDKGVALQASVHLWNLGLTGIVGKQNGIFLTYNIQ